MSDTAILIRGDLPFPTEPKTTGWVRNLLRPFAKTVAVDQHNETDISNNPIVLKRNKTVLVVDDDPVFVKATSARLQADGYDVITATDSCQATEALHCKMPDLVVLDVNLPDDATGMAWDGLKLVAWLSQMDAFKKIPVIMVTAGDAAKYTRLALNAGATAFFHKRMQPTRLLSLLENSLARKHVKPTEPSPEAPRATSDTNFQI
jgi:DNA-binding response OmpR family regulator